MLTSLPNTHNKASFNALFDAIYFAYKKARAFLLGLILCTPVLETLETTTGLVLLSPLKSRKTTNVQEVIQLQQLFKSGRIPIGNNYETQPKRSLS